MPQMQRQQRAPDQRPGMVWIPGGAFRMGSDVHYPEEAPVRLTNAQLEELPALLDARENQYLYRIVSPLHCF